MRRAVLTGVAVLALAGPAGAETWQVFSRSPNNAFLVEVDGIAVEGEITSIRVATVPKAGAAGDLSHSIEVYQFRCDANRWRTAGLTDYGPDGAEIGQVPEVDAEWMEARPGTVPAYLKDIACDGVRAVPPHWPTLQAYVEAGRP